MRSESNLVRHARAELAAIGMTPTLRQTLIQRALVALRLSRQPPFDYDGAAAAAVIDLVTVFARQEHSGFSAGWVTSTVTKLMRFEPLAPLTGDADEWNEVGDGILQNRRCSHVFMEGGQAYDSNGKVFVDASGCSFTSRDSRVDVTFPYVPQTEVVRVAEGAVA